MDKELKARWVEALRSGGYKQCANMLHDGAGYCCLGVLHKIHTGEKPAQFWSYLSDCPRPEAFEFLEKNIDGEDVCGVVASMNDSGKSFEEIADWIEANL